MLWLFGLFRDAVLGLLLLLGLSIVAREGLYGLARHVVVVLKVLPGVEWLLRRVLRRHVRRFLRQIERDAGREQEAIRQKRTVAIPEKGNYVAQIR